MAVTGSHLFAPVIGRRILCLEEENRLKQVPNNSNLADSM